MLKKTTVCPIPLLIDTLIEVNLRRIFEFFEKYYQGEYGELLLETHNVRRYERVNLYQAAGKRRNVPAVSVHFFDNYCSLQIPRKRLSAERPWYGHVRITNISKILLYEITEEEGPTSCYADFYSEGGVITRLYHDGFTVFLDQ